MPHKQYIAGILVGVQLCELDIMRSWRHRMISPGKKVGQYLKLSYLHFVVQHGNRYSSNLWLMGHLFKTLNFIAGMLVGVQLFELGVTRSWRHRIISRGQTVGQHTKLSYLNFVVQHENKYSFNLWLMGHPFKTTLGFDFGLKYRQRWTVETVSGNFQFPYPAHDSFNLTSNMN